MGCFSYLCVKCGSAIRQCEEAVLKHIRHGEVIGEATGPIDAYGRIVTDRVYRDYDLNNPNSNMAVVQSEYELSDSEGFRGKIYNGKPVSWMTYRRMRVREGVQDLCQEMYSEWEKLPVVFSTKRSGTEAWHKYCHDKVSEIEKDKHIISKGDPHQGFGTPRRKYMSVVVCV